MAPEKKRLGRPPLPPGKQRERTAITLPESLIQRARKSADEMGVSMSKLIEMALKKELKKDK